MLEAAKQTQIVVGLSRRPFMRRNFSNHMRGRCFFITDEGHIG